MTKLRTSSSFAIFTPNQISYEIMYIGLLEGGRWSKYMLLITLHFQPNYAHLFRLLIFWPLFLKRSNATKFSEYVVPLYEWCHFLCALYYLMNVLRIFFLLHHAVHVTGFLVAYLITCWGVETQLFLNIITKDAFLHPVQWRFGFDIFVLKIFKEIYSK